MSNEVIQPTTTALAIASSAENVGATRPQHSGVIPQKPTVSRQLSPCL